MSQYWVWFGQRAREPITENVPFAPGWARQDSVLNGCRFRSATSFLWRFCWPERGESGQRVAHFNQWWGNSPAAAPHPLYITSGENLCRALRVCVSRESSLESGMQVDEAVSTISSNQFNQETVGLCGLFLRRLKGELKKAALLPGGLTGVNTLLEKHKSKRLKIAISKAWISLVEESWGKNFINC